MNNIYFFLRKTLIGLPTISIPKLRFFCVAILLTTWFAMSHVATAQPTVSFVQVLDCYDETEIVILGEILPLCPTGTPTITATSQMGAVITPTATGFMYRQVAGISGQDIVDYEIVDCAGTTLSGQIGIIVAKCPDNIDIVECVTDPADFPWVIKEAWVSKQTDVCTYQTPMVGDLDGDGIPEIIIAKLLSDGAGTGSQPQFRTFQGLYVFWGNDRDNPTLIPTVVGSFQSQEIAMAKATINGVKQPFIVMLEVSSGRLTAYSPNPAHKTEAEARLWQSDPIPGYDPNNINFIGITDFDNCGEPEIYLGNLIYDARNGNLLKAEEMDFNKGLSIWEKRRTYNSIAADINNDGTPEFVAGNGVYKVHINDKNDHTKNYMELIASIPPIVLGSPYTSPHNTIKDGFTTVADINGDGYLDVIFMHSLYEAGCSEYGANAPGDNCVLVVWDPRNGQLLGYKVIPSHFGDFGVPFITDVDGCGKLEINFTTAINYYNVAPNPAGRVESYRWNGTNGLDRVYLATTSDHSGTTGITAFDFNLDGKVELVYRDETHLRIMEASGSSFVNIASFPCYSNTGFEMAVVADVDGDGAAEIVVVGGAPSSTPVYQGSLRIYKSGNQYNWAPARKVWNQYMYNVLNINEDLTVPQYAVNPATFFPGRSGLYDIQPYNNFLQQQTTIDQYGVPYMPLANIVWTTEPSITFKGDSAIITGCIKNEGSVGMQPPIYIAYYKNTTSTANFLILDSIPQPLLPGGSLCFTSVLNNISTFGEVNTIWISVNDMGTGVYPYQPQCEVDGRREFTRCIPPIPPTWRAVRSFANTLPLPT